MLVTDNDAWADRARRLRSHGMVKDPSRFLGLSSDSDSQPSTANPQLSETGPWYYEMQDLGYNYRITDFQSALGLSQLARLVTFIARRREIVACYNAAFAEIPWLTTAGVTRPAHPEHVTWHLYTVQIDFDDIGKTRTGVMAELGQKGIGTQVL